MTLSKEADDLEKFIKNIKPTFLYLFLGEIIIIALFSLFFSLIEKVFTLNFGLKLVIIFCFVILYFLYWYYKRKLPKFSEDENGILFAFNKIDTKTKEELDILFKKVTSNIEAENLESKVKIKILPEHISILNFKRSKEIREKSKAKVVIWGDVESGTINS